MNVRDRAAGWLLSGRIAELDQAIGIFEGAMDKRPWLIQEDARTLDIMRRHAGDILLSTDNLQDMTEGERLGIVAQSRWLYKKDIYAKTVVRLQTDYGFGRNISIVPEMPDEDETKEQEIDEGTAQDVWREFWTAKRNKPILGARKRHELSDRVCVDGEFFFIFFTAEAGDDAGLTTVRVVVTEQITGFITDPDDETVILYYKREWIPRGETETKTAYYPDWAATEDQLEKAELPEDVDKAEDAKEMTGVKMMHVKLTGLEKRGLPILMRGTRWIEMNMEFAMDRAAVVKSRATYTETVTAKTGSRGLKQLAAQMRSSLVTQDEERNPVPTAGSLFLQNEAAKLERLPLTTGAIDAEKDGALLLRPISLLAGVTPIYFGAGESFRLATATAMEGPVLRHFARYQMFWESIWSDVVDVVLTMYEDANDVKFETHEADVTMDALIETDLLAFGQALKAMAEVADIPAELLTRLAFQALNVSDAEDILAKMYPEGEEPEEEEETEEEPTEEAVLWMLFDVAKEMQDGDKDAAAMVIETVEDIQD